MLIIKCAQRDISFDDDLKLDISGIDEQHERLFTLCKTITESRYTHPLQIEAILLEIESYISEHLAYEEQILKKSSSLALLQHKKLHDQFRNQYYLINQTVQSADADPTSVQRIAFKIATLLQEWLCQHILKVDRQHRSHFLGSNHGVQQRSPRIKVNVRALLELSKGRGLTCSVVDVSDSGALLYMQGVPSWFEDGATALLHIIPLAQCDVTPCRIVGVSGDDIRIQFLERQTCDFYSALITCKHG
ncbi:MAG: hemerythrin domain-containing protein [Magnetococcales bacterium]|nr:hemerythrin domain-containing protein [Magnetococcales bacterium]